MALACGSQSTIRVFNPSSAMQAARLMAVVVLPTPPFWFTTPSIFPMEIKSKGSGGFRYEFRLWRTSPGCGKRIDAWPWRSGEALEG